MINGNVPKNLAYLATNRLESYHANGRYTLYRQEQYAE